MPSGVMVRPVAAASVAAGRAVLVGSVPLATCPSTQASTASTATDSSPQTDSPGVGRGRSWSGVMPGSWAVDGPGASPLCRRPAPDPPPRPPGGGADRQDAGPPGAAPAPPAGPEQPGG